MRMGSASFFRVPTSESRLPTHHTTPQPHLSQCAPCVCQHVIPGYQEILAHPLPPIAMTPNATPDICSATSIAASRSHAYSTVVDWPSEPRSTADFVSSIWEGPSALVVVGHVHLGRLADSRFAFRPTNELRVPVMTSQRIDSSIYKACGRDSDMAGLRGGRCWHRCFFNFISDNSRLRSAQQRATQTAAGQNRACCNRRAVSTARRASDWPRISLSMS